MKNILKHFVNLSVDAHASMEDIVRHLELFKNTSTYKDLESFYQNSEIDDRFIQQYFKGNYQAIYLDGVKVKNKMTLRKFAKKLIH